jgi:hypothetical protein
MNSDWLRWLLDVDVIPRDSDSLRLAWERPWPNWLWALLIIAAGVFAVWSYSRLAGNRVGRGILAGARFLIIFLVLILLGGPLLELPRETVEQDWVIFLADRSASMTIKDAEGASAAVTHRSSRDEQLRRALSTQSDVLSKLDRDRHMVWMGFHTGAFNLQGATTSETENETTNTEVAANPVPELGDPSGRRTNITGALEQVLQRAAARPVSGIVLFSDGRTDLPPSRVTAIVRRLQADAIPVHVVPLGSADPVGDLAVRRVDAPRRAFVRDKVPVVVELDRLGTVRDQGGFVKLIDPSTNEEFDRIEIPAPSGDGSQPEQLTLTAEPQLAGEATWQVVVETAQADLIPENNLKPFQIELIDRPLRVLYVEGYPRWEYHFVKNLLVREKSIESSVMLISASSDFAQEGNVPITRLPRSTEEFAQYDVIILGDVPATFFSPEQLEMVRAHVADRGAGLLWIAGERNLPATYAGMPLADLLPMRGSLNLQPLDEALTMTPTPLAERLGVLRLTSSTDRDSGWPQELANPATGWSQLYWAQRIEPGNLKPAAEVLAQSAPNQSGTQYPLVLNMRYGTGQSIYVATDEIWRWRYGRGEYYPNQFWMQMIRMLGRESLTNAGDPAVLEVNPRRVATGQPMRIELRVLDAQLMQAQRPTILVVLETEDGQRFAEIELRRVDGTEDRYAATYLPDAAGSLRVRLADPTLARLNMQTAVEVFAPDDELRRPETDHETLASLASSTGGRVIQPDELSQLLDPQVLKNRSVRTRNPLTESIWDSPLAFILALVALTAEWIGRKIMRLI